jgi:hypothetical protein
MLLSTLPFRHFFFSFIIFSYFAIEVSFRLIFVAFFFLHAAISFSLLIFIDFADIFAAA